MNTQEIYTGVKVEIPKIKEMYNDLEGDNCIVENVSVTKKNDTIANATYWVTYIPYKDSNNNVNKINVGTSLYYETNPLTHSNDGYGTNYENNPALERARDFAKRKNASIVLNGGTWGNQGALGDVIINGQIRASKSDGFYTLGFMDDDTFRFFEPTMTAEQILAQGCKNAISAFVPLVIDGVQARDEIIDLYANGKVPHPRQAIGQMPNKDIYVVTCDGKERGNQGMTMRDLARIFLGLGVKNAYNLDGGGSASTVVNGVFVNRPMDNNGYVERKCCTFLYIKKEYKTQMSQSILDNSFFMGEIKKMIDDSVRDMFYKTDFDMGYLRLKGDAGVEYQGIESWDGENKNTKLMMHKDYLRYHDYKRGKDIVNINSDGEIKTPRGTIADIFTRALIYSGNINDIDRTSLHWVTTETINSPRDLSYALLHIQNGTISAIQILFPFSETGSMKQRIRKSDGNWTSWR